MTPEVSPPRELSNSITGAILEHVRRVGGDHSVREVMTAASETRGLSELNDPAAWSSYAQTLHIFRAAAEVLGDDDLGRSVGEGLFAHYSSSEVVELLRSLDSPGEVLRLVAEVATKQTTITKMRCIEADERFAVISARTDKSFQRDRLFCDYTAGVFAAVPTIFGMQLAKVRESACQRKGNDSCVYHVSWDPATAADPETRSRFLASQVAALTKRFEALEEMASDLASVEDVDEALRMITERASVAVRAPRFLLAVRLPGEERLRIHQVGLASGDVECLAREVLADDPDDRSGSRLIVDVASSAHHYGKIAAVYPEGHRFLPEERRLFEAYSGHAAAALDTAAALDEARDKARTIGALFEMATSLSEVSSLDEVATRLALAILDVANCHEATVFVWEPDDAVLVCKGRATATNGGQVSLPSDSNGVQRVGMDPVLLEELVREPAPINFVAGTVARSLRDISRVAGFEIGIVMPVVARGQLLGMVAVNLEDQGFSGANPEVGRYRLDGIARIAATAFDNARLLDEVRHQAGHDPLTDLPNPRLLEELVRSALANARREKFTTAFLFVDLDHFKRVNDELGHLAGDAVLAEASDRLRAAVRAGDAVGRLGGDEFGVLMPRVSGMDTQSVVRRILEDLARPIVAAGTTVQISASIGVAFSLTSDDTFQSLRRRADAAMYQAKDGGRARYCVSGIAPTA